MRALLTLIAVALGSFRGTPQRSAAPVDTSGLSASIAAGRAAGKSYLPDAAEFTVGNRTIPAGTVVKGPVAVARGNIDVYGTVDGPVVAIDGDVRVHRGGHVAGDAWAAAGQVVIDGGSVDGTKQSVLVLPTPAPGSRASAPLSTLQVVKLVIGWFALLAIIGLGVMVFADSNLEGVVVGLERGFARSFWIGVAGQVVALPALVTLVVALALTVIGILLIPFAIVAYVIAAAGLVTLGFLAIARVTGGGITSTRGTTSPRGEHLRGLSLGLVIYFGLWIVAASFTWNPVVGAILRALAIAVTWVAATVGLGATLTSRAGTKRTGAVSGTRQGADDLAWQTPTPVSGVAAATRRVASVK